MKHCKGCSHRTICDSHGCAKEEVARKFGEAMKDSQDKVLKAQKRNEAAIVRRSNELIG